MDQWQPLRRREVKEFTSAGLAELETEPVPDGMWWEVLGVAVEGDKATSGGNTRARVYVKSGAVKHYEFEQTSPVADELYWEDKVIYVWEGERLGVEWDQAQANTTVKMYFTGRAWPMPGRG